MLLPFQKKVIKKYYMTTVLHLIPSFGPGGAERQLSLIASALARNGVEVHIAYHTGGPNLERLEHSLVHLHALESSSNYSPFLAWKIWRLVHNLRPHIVQTWLPQMDILGGIAALLSGIPLIVSERSSSCAYSSGLKTTLRLFFGRRATCIVANSIGGLNYWRTHLKSEQLYLVRNALRHDSSDSGQSNRKTQQTTSRPLVLYAGRFSYEKNISTLIEALILVAHRHPSATIMMFGEGPERDKAEDRIKQAGLLERVRIMPYTSELTVWLHRAAAFVSVSHFEGHPNVVMEAAAARCPLVLSNIPAHRELFDKSSALLVEKDSPQDITDAILNILSNPTYARYRAVKAKSMTMQFSMTATSAAYREIYEQVIGQSV